MAPTDPSPAVTLDGRHPGTTKSLRPARTAVARFLTDNGIDTDVVERAKLIVSELTTNAVDASPGRDYRLVVSIDAGQQALTIRVENLSPRLPPRPIEWGPEQPLAPRGRGLPIVEELADQVTVDRSGSTNEVSAEIRLDRP